MLGYGVKAFVYPWGEKFFPIMGFWGGKFFRSFPSLLSVVAGIHGGKIGEFFPPLGIHEAGIILGGKKRRARPLEAVLREAFSEGIRLETEGPRQFEAICRQF